MHHVVLAKLATSSMRVNYLCRVCMRTIWAAGFGGFSDGPPQDMTCYSASQSHYMYIQASQLLAALENSVDNKNGGVTSSS